MVTEIRIYYEGDRLLKPGFSQFFNQLRTRAEARRCRFHLITGGSGSTTCIDFGLAIESHPDAWNILLKDSEGPSAIDLSESLCREYRWNKSQLNSIFWMVEMMESWFHADKDALEKFYGQGFRKSALKANRQVEQIPKSDLGKGLKEATRNTSKGNYFDHKTSHAPKLLSVIDPRKVQDAAPNCKKLFSAVLAKLEEPSSQ